MKVKKSLFLLLLLACCIAFAQDKPKIAVYVASSDLKESEKKVLTTKILTPFVQSGKYRAIERSDAFLSGIARERDKQRDGSVDDSQISRLGREAGVQFVCVADLVDAFGIYSVSARLINTETAEIVGIGETEMKNLGDVGKAADEIFDQINSSKSSRNTTSSQKETLEIEKQKLALETEKQALEMEKQKIAAYEPPKKGDDYENFTTGRRWGTWALNAFTISGLGSWTLMGDVLGGFVHLGLDIAAILTISEEEVCSGEGYYYGPSCSYEPDYAYFTIFFLSGAAWNIYRSITYDKPKPKNAALSKYGNFNMAVLPTKNGNGMAYWLMYNKNF
jgi:hypothetical protein